MSSRPAGLPPGSRTAGARLPRASTAKRRRAMPRVRLAYLLQRPWRDIELPAGAVGIPTMLSKSERGLLYTLARDYAAGDAAIVDAGCFLGGSTAALLSGLRDRPKPWRGPPVVSYDLFRIEAYTIPKFFRDDPRGPVGESCRRAY